MVQFNSKHWKREYFQKVFFWISRCLPGKTAKGTHKFTSQATKNYHAKTSCNVSNGFELSNVSGEAFEKILRSLNTSKAAGMNQVPAKFLRDDDEGSSFERYNNFINIVVKLPRGE